MFRVAMFRVAKFRVAKFRVAKFRFAKVTGIYVVSGLFGLCTIGGLGASTGLAAAHDAWESQSAAFSDGQVAGQTVVGQMVGQGIQFSEFDTQAASVFLAKKKKKKKKKGGGAARTKSLTTERSYKATKGKGKTSLDFDDVDISGERKDPLNSLITRSRPDNEYDFVKIRLQWHPEMAQSASSLDGPN